MPDMFMARTPTSSDIEPEIITPATHAQLLALDETQAIEEAQLARLEALANLMDAQFNIPLLPIPIGLDTIVGLVPVVGDTISVGVSGFIVAGSHRLGVPKHHLTKMGANMFIDWLIGLVPIIGDLFDVGWRANLRNVTIARAHLEQKWKAEYDAVMRGDKT